MLLFILLVILTVAGLAASYLLFRRVFGVPSDLEKRVQPEDYLHKGFQKKYYSQVKELLYQAGNLEYRRFYIKSADGLKLSARYCEFCPGAPVDILVNGYRGCSTGDFCGIIPISQRMGHNVLLVDQRGTGSSEGSFQAFGILEKRDCLDWIKFVKTKFGPDTEIYLFGVSMGAATVLMTSEEVPDNVKGIISDCAYTTPKDIIITEAKQKKAPAGLVYPFIRLGAKLFGGFDLEECSAVEAVQHARAPICFIHGYEDRLIPYVMCGGMYDLCSAPKAMYTFKRADHACSYYSAPERYESIIRSFILEHKYDS